MSGGVVVVARVARVASGRVASKVGVSAVVVWALVVVAPDHVAGSYGLRGTLGGGFLDAMRLD